MDKMTDQEYEKAQKRVDAFIGILAVLAFFAVVFTVGYLLGDLIGWWALEGK